MDQPPKLIPEFIPPAETIEPVRTYRVPWLLAPLATIPACLLPRRAGPHLAASSWSAAYVAHFFSVALFMGLMIAEQLESTYLRDTPTESLSLSEHLRRPFAALVLFFYSVLSTWLHYVIAAGTVLAIEAGVWVLGLTLIPFYTAGERRLPLYLRCVKLTLWSTSCLVPLGILIGYPSWARVSRRMPDELAIVCMLLYVTWCVSVLMRLGGRYGGPKEGPAWEPRPMQCEECRYELTSQPIAGRCPECGRAVADSLPERRKLPAFASTRGVSARSAAFIATFRAALRSRKFARTLSVWRGHRAARQFAFLMCGLLGGLIAAPAYLVWSTATLDWHWPRHDWWRTACWVAVFAINFGLSCLATLMIAGLLVTLFGFLEAGRRSIVLCYSTAWLVLPTILSLLGVGGTYLVNETLGVRGGIFLPAVGLIDYQLLVGAGMMAPAVVTLVLWIVQLRWMLRETRYANG